MKVSRAKILVRGVIGGILSLILGICIAFLFPSFSMYRLRYIDSFVVFILLLSAVHLILWFFSRLFQKKPNREKFFCKNIILAEGWGSVIFVYIGNLLANDNLDVMFCTLMTTFWGAVSFIWTVLEKQKETNDKIDKQAAEKQKEELEKAQKEKQYKEREEAKKKQQKKKNKGKKSH
jgi:predicted permease